MDTNQLPDSARALLVAARRELPVPHVREQALEEMLEVCRTRSRFRERNAWATVAVGVSAAAALALWVLSSQPKPENAIVAELVPTSAATPVTVPKANDTSSETPPARPSRRDPESQPQVPKPALKQPLPARSALSLTEEVAALDAVRKAIDAGKPAEALDLLGTYQRGSGRKLNAEALVLRIEALAKSGNSSEASRLAREFVARQPASPLVDRARRYSMTEPPLQVPESTELERGEAKRSRSSPREGEDH